MFTLNHTYLSNNSRPISPFAAALAIAIALAAYCTSHATVASTEPVKDSGGLPVDLSVFAVTGEETDPLTVSFSNGDKTVTFIPMIHIATPDFYKAVAEKVKELKGKGATLYYEYVDFDVLDENNKRKVRAMVAFLPTPDMYNEISDDGYVGQRIGDFLGLVNDKDVNVDVTAEELIQAYEEEFGPIEVTGPDATSDISEMATTILPQENVEKIILSTRNKKIADAISYSAGALCHVTSGGDGQEAIYRTDGDRRRTYGFSPSIDASARC